MMAAAATLATPNKQRYYDVHWKNADAAGKKGGQLHMRMVELAVGI